MTGGLGAEGGNRVSGSPSPQEREVMWLTVDRCLGCLVLLAVLAGGAVQADDADARALVGRVLEAIPKQSFVAKLTVSSPEFSPRELQMSRKYVGNTHGSYLEVTAPEDLAGIRFLFLEPAHEPNQQYIKIKASQNAV